MTQKAFKTIAIAAVLSALSATSVFAQAAIQEPGLFAFYHPYLDVLNGGAPTPAARLAERPARDRRQHRPARRVRRCRRARWARTGHGADTSRGPVSGSMTTLSAFIE